MYMGQLLMRYFRHVQKPKCIEEGALISPAQYTGRSENSSIVKNCLFEFGANFRRKFALVQNNRRIKANQLFFPFQQLNKTRADLILADKFLLRSEYFFLIQCHDPHFDNPLS